MSQLRDTFINGNLTVNGTFNNTGLNTSVDIDIDTELISIINSIEGMDSITIDTDEEV